MNHLNQYIMLHLFGALEFPQCKGRIQERKKHAEMSVPQRQSFDGMGSRLGMSPVVFQQEQEQ